MNFMDAVKHVFSNYATFSGRARRSEYWYFFLFNFVVAAVLEVLARAISLFSVLSALYAVAVVVPTLAVIWRRFHDIGKSGAWYFIILVPLVGWIFVLIWLCKDSQPDTNQYGPSPKYPDAGTAYTAPAAASVGTEEDEFSKMLKSFKDSSK